VIVGGASVLWAHFLMIHAMALHMFDDKIPGNGISNS
jgi:hypothetical protein